ncbi:hypothetical protein Hamer_G010489, partial [Homarus americanus]
MNQNGSCRHEENLRALHLASWAGHTQVVRMILDRNADRESVAQ